MTLEQQKRKSIWTEPQAAAFLAAFVLFGFGIARCASADCPESCITAYGFNYCTPAAQLDTVVAVQGFDSGMANFDVPNGKLYAQCGGFSGIAPITMVEDEFTLLGVTPGTHVPLTAWLATTTSGFCVFLGTSFRASINNVGGSSFDLAWTDSDPVQSPLLSLPIVAVAGEPFRMRYTVTSGSECYSWIEGRFYFDVLPAGASLVSCKGFLEEPVSAQPSTWGSLKAQYRGANRNGLPARQPANRR